MPYRAPTAEPLLGPVEHCFCQGYRSSGIANERSYVGLAVVNEEQIQNLELIAISIWDIK